MVGTHSRVLGIGLLAQLSAGCSYRSILDSNVVNANTSRMPRVAKLNYYAEAGRSKKEPSERRFAFDHMDTVPYWYSPAISLFADVTQSGFLDTAEEWIIDRWKTPVVTSRWDLKSREARFSERNWMESSNDHGSEPILERFSTYLERHAMFCTVGELLQSRALAKVGEDHYDRFEVWLKEEGLAIAPKWLADFRSAKPMERQFWFEPTDIGTWLGGALDSEYLAELGASGTGVITVDAWHDTRGARFSSRVRLNSALVEPKTAASLMRSLQSVGSPYEYGLPSGDTDLEVNVPPYRLLGWLDDVTSADGIDSLDTMCRTITGIGCKPGARAGRAVGKSVSHEGNVTWQGRDGSVAFKHVGWSDKRRDDRSERQQHGLQSEGQRFSASVQTIHDCMVRNGMDLIISIKFHREEEGRDDDQEADREEKESHTAKIILLRQDGSIETCEGRIGTWQTPGRRA